MSETAIDTKTAEVAIQPLSEDLPVDTVIHGTSPEAIRDIPDESIDLVVTDPPYGMSFMGKAWDKALPSVDVWRECLRVLKPGAFAFVMCIPRQDCLSRMIINLEDAGFMVNFTPLFHTFGTGFPKAANLSKLADKKRIGDKFWELRAYLRRTIKASNMTQKEIKAYLGYPLNSGVLGHWIGKSQPCTPSGKDWQKMKEILPLDDRYDHLIIEAEREVIGQRRSNAVDQHKWLGGKYDQHENNLVDITVPATPEAKALEGSYAGFQPKPCVEIALVVMRPLAEKTYLDQALANGHGCTQLDAGRIPYDGKQPRGSGNTEFGIDGWTGDDGNITPLQGRFAPNLLCQKGIHIDMDELLQAKRTLNENA